MLTALASEKGLLGKAHLDRREVHAALHCFTAALAEGEDPAVHLGERWACYMLLGHFEKAWLESDRVAPTPMPAPGQPVTIRCDRGLGDTLQFLRYAPLLLARGCRVRIAAPASLLPLLRRMPAEIRWLAESPSAETGLEIECSQLPHCFRSTAANLPTEHYLHLPPQTTAPDVRRPFRVGLVWTAGQWLPTRSVPAEQLALLAGIRNVELYSLQRGPAGEALASPAGLDSLEPPERNILHTAAALQQLDLLITVDTMAAHLAGTLRRPTWLLLPFAADWRWLHARPTSPWYASLRLFRQPAPGDWEPVLCDVRAALALRARRGGSGPPSLSVDSVAATLPGSLAY